MLPAGDESADEHDVSEQASHRHSVLALTEIDWRPSPPGQPDKAVVILRFLLTRPIVERLRARAIREGVQLEAVVEAILEGVPE